MKYQIINRQTTDIFFESGNLEEIKRFVRKIAKRKNSNIEVMDTTTGEIIYINYRKSYPVSSYKSPTWEVVK